MFSLNQFSIAVTSIITVDQHIDICVNSGRAYDSEELRLLVGTPSIIRISITITNYINIFNKLHLGIVFILILGLSAIFIPPTSSFILISCLSVSSPHHNHQTFQSYFTGLTMARKNETSQDLV